MDHYKGKRHKRKIEVWFEENPKYAVQKKPAGPGPSGGKWLVLLPCSELFDSV